MSEAGIIANELYRVFGDDPLIGRAITMIHLLEAERDVADKQLSAETERICGLISINPMMPVFVRQRLCRVIKGEPEPPLP